MRLIANMTNLGFMMKKAFFICAAVFFSPLLYASFHDWKPLVALNIGPQWDDPGERHQFSVEPATPKTYAAVSNPQTLMGAELFVGGQHILNSWSDLQLGIAVAMTSLTSLSGDIWEDADPDFNNYTYAYKLAPFRATLSAKWLFNKFDVVTPYLNVGLGLSFNRSYDYSIMPKIFEEVPSPFYTSNVPVSFAYDVGLGLQRQLGEHIQVGLGYVFSDWGQSSLGRAPKQTTNAPLSLSHLYMNQCVVSLSYFI